jgi:alkyl hydroperoxide reductase subunit AhpC
VLAFYPYNWQEATAQQLIDLQVQRPRLLANDAEIIAITVDSIMNTTTWEREIGPFQFAICADFWPHGEVCMRYGVLYETGHDAGASKRALFVIDRNGRVKFRKVYKSDEVVVLEEVFGVLENR